MKRPRMAPIRFRLGIPILARLIIVILATGSALIVLELLARLYLATVALPRTDLDFRKRQPAPYKNAPYFSPGFIAESFAQPGGWQYPKGTRLIIPNDYSGKYFHVVQGTRVTASQPEAFSHTVYLFGGSTVYNSEVPDDLTIASQLQLLFNAQYGDRYIVRNYGTTTVTITQQLERLRTVNLKAGDIVVFFDGDNDIIQDLFYSHPEESMTERNRRTVAEMGLFQRTICRIHGRLSGWSALVQLTMDVTDRGFPAHLADPKCVEELLASLRSRYKTAIEASYQLSTSQHAAFYHFLQPHLFADDHYSDYERQLLQNYYVVPRGMKEAFEMGYPELRAISFPANIQHYDFTDILNERPDNQEYYLDSWHVNHEANCIIAARMFEKIDGHLRSAGARTEHACCPD